MPFDGYVLHVFLHDETPMNVRDMIENLKKALVKKSNDLLISK